jgi:hypothetical protein
MQSKLSKLQCFILSQALAGVSAAHDKSQALNAMIAQSKPNAPRIEEKSYPHVTRNQILVGYFGLPLKKDRLLGGTLERIDMSAAGAKCYRSASVSFALSAARLKRRGLIRQLGKKSRYRLTAQGIVAALGLEF